MASETTLVVVTRDRPHLFAAHLLPGLTAIAAAGHPVIVVDQSADTVTRQLVEGLSGVQYLQSGKGLSVGRNVGLAAVRTWSVAFTDDDVEIDVAWIEGLHRRLAADPAVGAVVGRATDAAGRLLPGSEAGKYWHPTNTFGLGSGFNMAFATQALRDVGPFDEELGAGARYFAAEDTDMLYRVLRHGWAVECSDEERVVHRDEHRSGRDIVQLHHRYGVGAGAQVAKHRAAGDRDAGPLARRHVRNHLTWTAKHAVRLRFDELRLQGAYLNGMASGYLAWRRNHRAPSAGSDTSRPEGPTSVRSDEQAAPAEEG